MAYGHTVLTFRSAGRQPQQPPLPPLVVLNRLKPLISMEVLL